jgi:transcription elongation factor Elf1
MIKKHIQLSKDDYAKLHRDLRRKLERKAFNEKYCCASCGAKNSLEIHIPNPDLRLKDQPGFYQILCSACHLRKKRSTPTPSAE